MGKEFNLVWQHISAPVHGCPGARQFEQRQGTARAGADVRQEAGEENEGGEAGEAGERGEGGEGGEGEASPLAPLSLAGLSLMGAAILLAKQD